VPCLHICLPPHRLTFFGLPSLLLSCVRCRTPRPLVIPKSKRDKRNGFTPLLLFVTNCSIGDVKKNPCCRCRLLPLFVLQLNKDISHSLGTFGILGPILGKINNLAQALPAVVVLQVGLDGL